LRREYEEALVIFDKQPAVIMFYIVDSLSLTHSLYRPGIFSSIHLRGRLGTTTAPNFVPSCMDIRPFALRVPSSRLWCIVLRAGHGRTDDADTVSTAPRNVRTKSDETKERRVDGAIRGMGKIGDIVAFSYSYCEVVF